MAASIWQLFNSARHKIGNGDINLSADTFSMSLHRTSASAQINGDVSILSEIGDEVVGGGYAAKNLTGVQWGTGTSAGQQKWDSSDPVFTASASATLAIRYGVITNDTGLLLCFGALSAASFDLTTGQTMTVAINSNGIFTLT